MAPVQVSFMHCQAAYGVMTVVERRFAEPFAMKRFNDIHIAHPASI